MCLSIKVATGKYCPIFMKLHRNSFNIMVQVRKKGRRDMSIIWKSGGTGHTLGSPLGRPMIPIWDNVIKKRQRFYSVVEKKDAKICHMKMMSFDKWQKQDKKKTQEGKTGAHQSLILTHCLTANHDITQQTLPCGLDVEPKRDSKLNLMGKFILISYNILQYLTISQILI